MRIIDLLAGLAVLLGVVGVVVPVLPGSALVLGAVLVWAAVTGTGTAWLVFAVATTFLVVGAVAKYALPGRRLREAGVPNHALLAGAALGAVGFFVVPVLGLLLGFVLGVYLAELRRLGRDRAWTSTRAALRAAGVSLLIELGAALLAAVTWVAGAVVAA